MLRTYYFISTINARAKEHSLVSKKGGKGGKVFASPAKVPDPLKIIVYEAIISNIKELLK